METKYRTREWKTKSYKHNDFVRASATFTYFYKTKKDRLIPFTVVCTIEYQYGRVMKIKRNFNQTD